MSSEPAFPVSSTTKNKRGIPNSDWAEINRTMYDACLDTRDYRPKKTGIWTLRLVGLSAFFYGLLHFLTYFTFDREWRVDGLWEDVVKRPYITAGFTAFVLMIPRAATSTTGWIRRMGGRRWNRLHQLISVTGLAAALHYFWKVKLETTQPIYYGAIVIALLAVRAWRWSAQRAAS